MKPALSTATQRRQVGQRDVSRALRVRTHRWTYPYFNLNLDFSAVELIRRRFPIFRQLGEWTDAFALLADADYDLIHCYNAIPLWPRKPFITTFEDVLPRIPQSRPTPVPQSWLYSLLRPQLLSARCLAVVAMSDFAARQFRWQNRTWSELAEVEAKLVVIRPHVRCRRITPKIGVKERLRTVFVGQSAFRKGLPAVLNAHEVLRRQGIPIETVVVSNLQWSPKDTYFGPADARYVQRERERVERVQGVIYYPSLNNDDVLSLMDESDFSLTPTFHDTFGYATLEAIAGGTPAIVTSTCAQPELIEDNVSGFLLPFENDSDVGKWIWMDRLLTQPHEYQQAYEDTIDRLTLSLSATLMRCWESRADYERLSAGALRQAQTRFSPERAREAIERLYARLEDG